MITFITQKKLKNPIPVFALLSLLAKVFKFLRIEKYLNNSVLFIVRGYQLYISPHKGFSCAYKKLHSNEQSCSTYFYTCVESYDLSTASVMLQQRFKECNQANEVLKGQVDQTEKPQSKKQSKKNNSSCCCSSKAKQPKKSTSKKRNSKKNNQEGVDLEDIYDCCSFDYFPICGFENSNFATSKSGDCCGNTNDCNSCDTSGCETNSCDTGSNNSDCCNFDSCG